MNITICGAGTVGSSVAEALARENNNVTLADTNGAKLKRISERLDIKTVLGDAADPDILVSAAIEDADILLAVTTRDDTNIVICQLAHSLYKTPNKFARLRNSKFLEYKKLFRNDDIPIDAIITPEQLVSKQIMKLIEHPGALQILDFAQGKIQLAAVRVGQSGALVGQEVSKIPQIIPELRTRVAAIYRQEKGFIPTRNTVIQPDDEVFFIAAQENISKVINSFYNAGKTYGKRVMLAGGGNIGLRLAHELEPKSFRVKLIELNRNTADRVADELENTIVIDGNASDRELMLRENIEHTEIYCAVTNDDEANILSAMLAKKLGAHRTMALTSNTAYVDILENSGIDILITPNFATIGELLRHMRRGDIKAVYSLRRGAAEALEIAVHGRKESSKVIGRTINELDLPPEVNVGAVLRGDEVLIANSDILQDDGKPITLQDNDRIILFVIDKGGKQISQVEKLFEVGITFF